MSNDIDVRIGVQTTGDTSGAQAVDAAVKQVGETAKQVAQDTAAAAQQSTEATTQAAQTAAAAAGSAAEKVGGIADELAEAGKAAGGLGELDGAVDGLKDALGALSPDKAKGLVNGLTGALQGLASGDTSQSLAGLGRTLFSLSSSLPLPGVGAAVAASLGIIAGLYKLFAADVKESERPLNEFGENVDAEMERLESWAQSQLEWTGIKDGNAKLRDDFKLVQTTAEGVWASINALFSAGVDAKVEGLNRQAAAAAAGGDTAKAEELKAQAQREQIKAELVKILVEMTETKVKQSEALASAKLSEDRVAIAEQAVRSAKEAIDAVKDVVVSLTGNTDAAQPGSTANSTYVAGLNARADAAGEESVRLSSIKGYENLAAARRLEEEGLRKLADQVANIAGMQSDLAEKEKELADARKSQSTDLNTSAADYTKKGVELETLKTKFNALATQVTPDVVDAATRQSTAITDAITDTMEAFETVGTTGVSGLKAAGDSSIAGAKAAAADITAGGETMRGASEEAGVGIFESQEAAAEVIGEGAGLIQEAVKGTATAATEAGGEIKAGAEQFRLQLSQVLGTWNPAISGLVDSGHKTLTLVESLAAAQADLAQRVSSAQASANLALSQNRNA